MVIQAFWRSRDLFGILAKMAICRVAIYAAARTFNSHEGIKNDVFGRISIHCIAFWQFGVRFVFSLSFSDPILIEAFFGAF